MCRRQIDDDHFCERRALATGLVEIRDIEGICRPLVFHATGHKVRIYMNPDWGSFAREAAIVYLLTRTTAFCHPAEAFVAGWRETLVRVVGDVGAAVGTLAACLAVVFLLVAC